MRTGEKNLIIRWLTCLLLIIIAAPLPAAYACTAVYVGSQASDDGTIILAKSNDYQDVWANYVDIVERVENVPGRVMPVDNDATVFAELPETTYPLYAYALDGQHNGGQRPWPRCYGLHERVRRGDDYVDYVLFKSRRSECRSAD